MMDEGNALQPLASGFEAITQPRGPEPLRDAALLDAYSQAVVGAAEKISPMAKKVSE